MAPHCSTLAWKIPWTEEPGGLQSMGLWRVRHDWATSLSLFTFMHWRRKWQPTPVFLPGESQGREAWWAAVYGIAQSRKRLKRLSSSSSSNRLPLLQASWQCFSGKMLPQSAEGRKCFPRVHRILKHRFLCYKNKLILPWQKYVDCNYSYFDY